MSNLRKDLTEIEAVLASVLAVWGIVAANLTTLGVPERVVSTAGGVLAVLALVGQKALEARKAA